MSVMIWVLTVCKGYQQTIQFGANNECINCILSLGQVPIFVCNLKALPQICDP